MSRKVGRAARRNRIRRVLREFFRLHQEEIDRPLDIVVVPKRNLDPKTVDLALVEQDIRGVVQAAPGRITKVILETGLLTDEEKVQTCLICKAAGAGFVKTSTGFAKGSAATEADIALMRKAVGPDMGVKASGGVRSLADAQKMLAAGATRIGASSGVAIVTGGVGSGY